MAKNDPSFEISAIDKFSRVLREARGQLKEIDGSLGGLGQAARAITPAMLGFVGSLSVAGVVAGFKSLVDGIDDIADRAQGLGITATALADMQVAATQAGVGGEELDAALTRLNVRMVDSAKGGKESAAIFKAMGIAVKDSAGNLRSTEEVLRDVSNRFASYRDGAEKSALAVELFGRAGAKLIAYLNGGADSLRTYSGLTEETVRETARMAAEFDKLAANAEKAKNAIAGALVPAVNALFDLLDDQTQNAPDLVLKRLQTRLADLQKQVGQRQNPEMLQAIRMEIDEIQRSIAKLDTEAIDRMKGWSEGFTPPNVAPPAPKVNTEELAKLEQLRKVTAEAREEFRKTGISEYLKNEARDAERARAVLDGYNKTVREAADAREEFRRAGLDENRRREEADAARERARVDHYNRQLEESKRLLDEVGLAFESAFSKMIAEGGVKVGDVFKALARDITQVIYQMLILDPIIKQIKKSLEGLSTGFNWASIFSFGGAKAEGGPVYPGSAYLVGEKGPELFVPNSAGRIVPNDAKSLSPRSTGMGGVTVVQHIRIDARSDIGSIRQAMEATRQRTEASILDSMRRRGAFARA
jgi:hypothetical protein